MSLSGVTVSDAAVAAFNDLKTKKVGRYVTFNIVNDKEIGVTTVGDRAATYDDFLKTLANDTPCYTIFDCEFTNNAGETRDKIVFISWIPDNAKVKAKMLYASSKAALGNALGGGFVELAGSDLSDVDFDALSIKLKK